MDEPEAASAHPPNVVAITCGVQRRQVPRLVGRRGSADGRCRASPLLERDGPHSSKAGRLLPPTAPSRTPDRKC